MSNQCCKRERLYMHNVTNHRVVLIPYAALPPTSTAMRKLVWK